MQIVTKCFLSDFCLEKEASAVLDLEKKPSQWLLVTSPTEVTVQLTQLYSVFFFFSLVQYNTPDDYLPFKNPGIMITEMLFK